MASPSVRAAIKRAMEQHGQKPKPAAPPPNPLRFTDPRAFKEFEALGDYLEATPRAKRPPLTKLLHNLHPEAQAAARNYLAIYDVAATGGGRSLPFQRRTTPDEAADLLDVPPALIREIHEDEVNRELTRGLQARLGTDADRPEPPVTMRQQIEAAFDLHEALGD